MTVDFGRVLTAMVSPFDKNMELNLPMARKLARHLVDSGSDGLVVCGTTGESPTLSKEEKLELFRTVVDEVGGRAVVVAGTGSYSTKDSIALTQAAEKLGVDAVMLVCPYYNKPSQDGLYQHFRAVAESTNLPVMIYNIPGRTSINLLPQTCARLAEIGNIVAIKEASGNMDQATELRRLLPDHFHIYSGDDSMTLPLLAVGGKGVVSVAAHLVGGKIQEMINAFTSGNITLAAKLHSSLFPLIKGLFMTTNPVPVKAALGMLGLNVGPPRLPLVEATEQEKEKLRVLLREAQLL
ncbi:4-hydroxy-tetrahydrodipicolinate synthase [Candidatus Desulforudis audaxviator]|uniref:4-hydroxy-tetrahydrodipicolinate synthase n=1 Tax=Desulforudis audaxviator (strain MP104C) TaxID=477974 RepID=DAPA_DESAP|nr:4-hydroxy-tetrahydrodipicolinate synthase [Candidatus Desulforudis audaxviator]B1I383.1 RecName: Full=4-hydroxy-tetrahydrodipicolinate synthase; Short=HTPA synthase [Candidatus Desulforudis audaxviator MP104C]ACA59459.1 dihydrodipicolinate synthase [Candidatus Desulforudis audaxviator MP104C]AZK59441.1 4-hydroxy-tetrahydrodipicolinate synthase [Candidatus Desulforudis audaxviator]